MVFRKNIFGIIVLGVFISCIAVPQENPTVMFTDLFEKYLKTDYKDITLSQQSEGASMFIFDINNKISEDLFYQVFLLSTMGQTQYLIYKKNGENAWYFHKKAYFYEEPMKLENAEILNTYFMYKNDLPYAFNDLTGKYDIQADTRQFRAITDIRSLAALIEIVQNADDR